MRRRLLAFAAALAAVCCIQPAANAAQTTVVHLTPRTSTTVLTVYGGTAIYDARAMRGGSACNANTYISIQPIWKVRRVSRTSVHVAGLTLRMSNRRSVTMGGGFIETGGSTYTYRKGGTTYGAGSHDFRYTINRTMSTNRYRELRATQRFDFGGVRNEPYYCSASNILGFWARVS